VLSDAYLKYETAPIAAQIADALGRLPLALVQAASVIADGMRAADHLDLLRKQVPKLFAEGHTPDRRMTTATTRRVSVDRLAQRSAAALAMQHQKSATRRPTAFPAPPEEPPIGHARVAAGSDQRRGRQA
jgi:hypothetical protein